MAILLHFQLYHIVNNSTRSASAINPLAEITDDSHDIVEAIMHFL